MRNSIPEAPPIIAKIVTGKDVWFDGSCVKFLQLRNLEQRQDPYLQADQGIGGGGLMAAHIEDNGFKGMGASGESRRTR